MQQQGRRTRKRKDRMKVSLLEFLIQQELTEEVESF
jgi:hypothetical protein